MPGKGYPVFLRDFNCLVGKDAVYLAGRLIWCHALTLKGVKSRKNLMQVGDYLRAAICSHHVHGACNLSAFCTINAILVSNRIQSNFEKIHNVFCSVCRLIKTRPVGNRRRLCLPYQSITVPRQTVNGGTIIARLIPRAP